MAALGDENKAAQQTESARRTPDLRRFHHYKLVNGKEVPVSVFDYEIFSYIKENYAIFICGVPYLYIGGVYVADRSGTKIKKIIRGLIFKQFIKSRTINQIYSLIVDAEELQKEVSSLNNYPKSYINFRDCMLDVQTMKKLPHNPAYLSINQIPFHYADVEKAAEGQEIKKFLNFAIPDEEDRKMLLEYAGYSLTADASQQRFLMICGIGGTGKSVLIRLLESMVGQENVSNVSMQELNKRFSTSLLLGKILNSCADLSMEALEDSSTMKKLIGEDWIMAEFKGKDGFMFKSYSKLLFSTNMLPVITTERTNGFYRRLLILKMDKKPDKPDTGLADKLLHEIPYFIRLAVQALYEMYQRGIMTESANSKEAVLQMWKDSDVVQAWINDCCTVGADLRIERGEAFESFKEYCENEERQALTKNGFFKALRTKNLIETRNDGTRYFMGISLKKVPLKSALGSGFIKTTEQQFAQLQFIK